MLQKILKEEPFIFFVATILTLLLTADVIKTYLEASGHNGIDQVLYTEAAEDENESVCLLNREKRTLYCATVDEFFEHTMTGGGR